MTNHTLEPLVEYSYDLPKVLDSTMIVTWRKCQRYFFNSYVNHIRGGTTETPLLFGGTFAKGLEVYRQSVYSSASKFDHELAFHLAYLAMIENWGDNPSQLKDRKGFPDKRTLDRCIFALKQYFENYPPETDALQPHITPHNDKVSFEFSCAVPLDDPKFPRHPSGDPFILCGRMDTLGTYNGLPCWSDEKTTTRGGATWADQWVTRHQFMTYRWLLRTLGFKANRVVVRGIVIHANDTLFMETPPILIQDWMVDKWEEELCKTLYDMIRVSELSRKLGAPQFSRDFGDACYSYFRRCPYWDACSAKPRNEISYLKMMPRNVWDPLHIFEEEAA